MSNFIPISLHMLKVYLSTQRITYLYVLFFCQYWNAVIDEFKCLIKLFTEPVFIIIIIIIIISFMQGIYTYFP